jgi:hypothetical protein
MEAPRNPSIDHNVWRNNTIEKLETSLNDGTIFAATDLELNEYLRALAFTKSASPYDTTQDTNRVTLLSTIKTFRFIDALDRSNQRLSCLVIALTILTLITQALQLWAQLRR